ncbi:MAG: hypothetical protein OXQ90_14910 [Gammaproteobacteria bacterium]|nr:hypothetical protein [Gammaproteobacteria bacterium]
MRIWLIAVAVVVGIVIGFATARIADRPTAQVDSETPIASAAPVEPARFAPPEPAMVLTLAEIAGLVNDFDRNEALYAHIADMEFARLLELLGEADALSESSHRYDVVRVIYLRMATLDPEATVDHVLGRSYRTSWLNTVFRAWAHADLDAAVARAAFLDFHAKTLATRAILELDLSEDQRGAVARRLDGEEILAGVETREDLADGASDFRSAWQEGLKETDTNLRMQRLAQIARTWAESDPFAALQAAGAMPNTQLGMALQGLVLQTWTTDDPVAAIAWLGDQEPSFNLQALTVTAIAILAQENIGNAISFLDSMPDHLQEYARQGLVSTLQMPTGDISDADIDTVLDWYATLDATSQRKLSHTLSFAIAQRQPERALDWAQSLEGQTRKTALSSVLSSIALTDLEQAERLVAEVDDPELRFELSTAIAYAAANADPRRALEWAQSFESEPERVALVGSVLNRWANDEPDVVVDVLLDMRRGPFRDQVTANVAMRLVRDQIDLAERLFDAIESAEFRRPLASMLRRHFAQTDPNKAEFYRDAMD